jgi:hypothetical protein
MHHHRKDPNRKRGARERERERKGERERERESKRDGHMRVTVPAVFKTLPGRLELPTLRLTTSRSNQLSYGSQ